MTTPCACGSDSHPYQQFENGKGLVRRCGGCAKPLEDEYVAATAAQTRPTPQSIAEAMLGGPVANAMFLPAQSKPAAPAPVAVQPPPMVVPAASASMTGNGIVTAARERLSAVKIQLAALANLKAEEALLERMLGAVELPPN